MTSRNSKCNTYPEQTSSGADSIGHGARVPTFTNGWARRAPRVEEQPTRNWQNCTDHHESTHQND